MKVLLVEDEQKIAEFMATGLCDEGYQVDIADSAEKALDMIPHGAYETYVLDVMLPGMDGITLCRQLRESGITDPILILTARGSVPDKVSGLDAGADDYLTKPFEFAELVARLRALSRKTKGYRRSILQVADLFIDPNLRVVNRNGQTLDLSRKEYLLLEYLTRNHDRLVTRPMISQAVWENDNNTYTNIIDVFITHLRKKVDEGHELKLIHTIRGKGFMLSAGGATTE